MLDAIYGTETLSPLARFNLDAFRNWFSACTFGLLEFGRLAGGLLLFIPFSRMLEESSGWVSCISPAFRSLNHNAIVWIMCWWCECYSFYLENCELEGSCSGAICEDCSTRTSSSASGSWSSSGRFGVGIARRSAPLSAAKQGRRKSVLYTQCVPYRTFCYRRLLAAMLYRQTHTRPLDHHCKFRLKRAAVLGSVQFSSKVLLETPH